MTDIAADRDRILEAAERLFYSQGVQAVGMDAVRTAAGVPLKRLYAQFPSKDALVVEVMQYRRGIWDAGLAAAAALATTPEEKLLAIFDFLGDWFRDDDFRGCGFINAFGELGGVSPAVAGMLSSTPPAPSGTTIRSGLRISPRSYSAQAVVTAAIS